MKAKLKPLIILLCICISSLVGAIIAGCSIGEPTIDTEGMDAIVTYYINGGNFKSTDTMSYKTLYYKGGTPILNIGLDSTGRVNYDVTKPNFEFAGWKYAALEDGKPILRDSDGNKVPVKDSGSAQIYDNNGRERSEQEKKFTAEVDEERGYVFENGHPVIQSGEHLYLVADWSAAARIEFILAVESEDGDDEVTFTVNGEEKTYAAGDVIHNIEFEDNTQRTVRPFTFLDNEGFVTTTHTYICLYNDAELTDPVKLTNSTNPPLTVRKPQPNADGETENVKFYVLYVKGEWTPVRTSIEVGNMIENLSEEINYYVFDDITYTGSAFTSATSETKAVIRGNGKTISNLKFSLSSLSRSNFSIFGSIREGASITNLTLKNVEYTAERIRSDCTVYLVMENIAEGVDLSGFKVEGATMTVTTYGSFIATADGNRCLYGRAYESDAAFEEVYGKIVTGAVITVNDEKVLDQTE